MVELHYNSQTAVILVISSFPLKECWAHNVMVLWLLTQFLASVCVPQYAGQFHGRK